MARKEEPVLVNSKEQVKVSFRFQHASGTDPDALVPYNAGVSNVTRSGAGVFLVTLDNIYPVYIGHMGSVGGDSGATLGLIVQGGHPDDYNATTGVLTVRVVDTYTDATPAAADPADDDWVYVEATFCRRSNMAPSGAI